jgi:hypothetical protein
MPHDSRSGQGSLPTRFIVLGIDNVLKLGTLPDKEMLSFGLPYLIRLKSLCEKTDAKLIVSSSWRTLHTPEELSEIARSRYQVRLVFQEPTPRLVREPGESDDRLRQREVQLWITRAKSRGLKIRGLAVVDRFSFNDPLNRYHIQAENGFTRDVAEKAEALLLGTRRHEKDSHGREPSKREARPPLPPQPTESIGFAGARRHRG